MFTQTPFSGNPGTVVGYTPAQDPTALQHAMARTVVIESAGVMRHVHPIIGQYFRGPVSSPLQRIQAPPLLLPSAKVSHDGY